MVSYRSYLSSIIISLHISHTPNSNISFLPSFLIIDIFYNKVPTAGMIIGNSISGPAVAVDRLLADVADKRHESETRLAFGATRNEAILPTMRSAILVALTPNLNTMSVVGLVSIPGKLN